MNKEKVLEIMAKLRNYNIHFISFDDLGEVNIDNLKVSEEYLFDILEEIE